jgi:multidrug efflux pump subunit AcrB
MVFIILTIAVGIRQFMAFPRQEDPPITIREVVITAFFPGMNPIDIEQLITRKIEARLRTLPEIKDIWSDSKTGKVIIHADTRDEYDNLDLIWQKIRNRMTDLRSELPEGTIGPFVNDEFGLTAVATIALTGEGFSMAEMRPVAHNIRDQLYDLEGIRKVELWGIQNEQIYLKYSSTMFSQKGIGIREIIDALVQQNVVLPGGVVDAG